jgi:hypothetical protein
LAHELTDGRHVPSICLSTATTSRHRGAYTHSRQPSGLALVPSLKSGTALLHGPLWRLKLKPYLLNVRVERGQ